VDGAPLLPHSDCLRDKMNLKINPHITGRKSSGRTSNSLEKTKKFTEIVLSFIFKE
jgi:hypothetical protein